MASSIELTDSQKQDLASALNDFEKVSLFAVRSSSPEEDLDGLSFAGGYETVLGVVSDKICSAVKRAFASCLDYRVFVYKKEHGFDIFAPKIAVVVRKQIASDKAGVGFSINPINNSFDEAVINSNWGLGESVVSGAISPDTFIIDKNTCKLKEFTGGKKEKTIWLDYSGGTCEEENFKSAEASLSGDELAKLCKLIKKVEDVYGKPMDIEWAFSQSSLFLLQARPITAYVPVSPEMTTPPGEDKHLYLDATISVQGLYRPMSKMATSLIDLIPKYLGIFLFRKEIALSPRRTLAWVANGRIYINLSLIFHLFGKHRFASFINVMDSLASETILTADEKEYTRSFNLLSFFFFASIAFLQIFPFIAWAFLFPKQAHRLSQKMILKLVKHSKSLLEKDIGLDKLCEELIYKMLKVNARYSAPIALLARKILSEMESDFSSSDPGSAQKLSLALPNNITTEMDFELYRLASIVPDALDEEQILNLLKQPSTTDRFIRGWENFLEKFGHRCAGELDLASPRYRDRPEDLIRILLSMHFSPSDENPLDKFKRQENEREEAFEHFHRIMRSEKGFVRAWIFKRKYSFAITYAGYREMHKFLIVLAFDIIRRRVLKEADILCKEGRLDSPNQIFDLSLDELCRGLKDKSIVLSQVAREGTAFMEILEKAKQLPTVFDSRGRILRPPKKAVNDGEIEGKSISPGKATGKIKVLASPTEKAFLKGEILVARATDPGWTPLFVNASAVVLEVGGLLQHGALVAREYGLPCVAGIEDATSILKDGMMVEVDGTNGVIRILEQV